MTKNIEYIDCKGSQGFSLVEITLALLVIAVGLLAVFGLLGDSLRANTKTQDDTIAASFAESVFSSIFAADWDDTEFDILMGEAGFWDSSASTTTIELCNENEDRRNKYSYTFKDSDNDDVQIEYYVLRYNLFILEQTAVWRAFRLKVWIGEYADTSTRNTDVYEFYTQQYKFIDPRKEYEEE